MLDWPLMEVLDCAWVGMDYRGSGSHRNAKIQKTVYTDGHSGRLYGHGGLRPTFVSHQRGWGHNADAMIHYREADVREALDGLRKEKGDLYEGIQLQFINPATGASVGTILDCAAQLLRPGEETRFKRETSNTFLVVMDGQGYTESGRPPFRLGSKRHRGDAEFPVAATRQHRQEGRRALHGFRRRADEKHRAVSRAGQDGRRHRGAAGALS
jgi:gentisate 1,2-dioxygenase